MQSAYEVDPLNEFISMFGDDRLSDSESRNRAVLDAMRACWEEHGFVEPHELFHYLLNTKNNLMESQRLYLASMFLESFVPEHTTGYYARHRDPLVNELAQTYVQQLPEKPLYRIEMDLMNLGGLNLALGSERRALADQVIGIIAGMVRQKVAPLGTVCAVRHGGDESKIMLSPREGVTEQDIKNALVDVEAEIRSFVMKAGLQDIPRPPKKGSAETIAPLPEGFGVGLGVVKLEAKNWLKQQLLLEAEIELSKLRAKVAYHALRSDNNPPLPAQPEIVQQAVSEYKNYLPRNAIEEHQRLMDASRFQPLDLEKEAGSPEERRYNAARKQMLRRAGDRKKTSLSDMENTLLQGTLMLTRNYDDVTNMPMFTNMEQQLRPIFEQNEGAWGELLHVDFSNMGGGNLLGSWVGNAMAKQFAQCIRDAYKEMRWEPYIPYIASNGGGRFTALLPQQKDIQKFRSVLSSKLAEASAAGLSLTEEEKAETRNILAHQGGKCHTLYGEASPFDEGGNLCMDRIKEKNGLGLGVRVQMASAPLSLGMPISQQLKRLESAMKQTNLSAAGETHEHQATPEQSWHTGQSLAGGDPTAIG